MISIQTFLPYPDFKHSAAVLDRQRLGKQRVEALQILQTLHKGGSWQNHPAVRMWAGHEMWLISYGMWVCQEWIDRGYKDTTLPKIKEFELIFGDRNTYPSWLGKNSFHHSHRSNLVRKKPEHYRKFWPYISDQLPYLWPITQLGD